MKNAHKYRPFPFRVSLPDRTWPDKQITAPPAWCSVDLRDGNQALPVPMNVDQKLEFFKLLCDTGFKEIEVGFPSASQIEYDFTRQLIEEHLIPDDVYIQVLTQARPHLIDRTVEAVQGAKKVILHMYVATSVMHRTIVFKRSKEEVKKIAVDGTLYMKSLLPRLSGTEVVYEFSPEAFNMTEPEFALEVCEAVVEAWNPKEVGGKVILNLPATVEGSTPNVYADQIEWFCRNFSRRDEVIISVHTHNDRDTGVAATELALLAGAERVEGTLFGNGERTGNLDIVAVALNMYAEGVDPGLDLSDLPRIRSVYERCTGMTIHPRHPYAGDLVFTAFSGSHQDAIKKAMDLLKTEKKDYWEVPYLPIDPMDIGRSYKAIIRINSQSGKGGVSYILQEEFGLEIPKGMHPEVGKKVNEVSDALVRELSPQEVYEVFEKHFLNLSDPYDLVSYKIETEGKTVHVTARVKEHGEEKVLTGTGNGPIDAFVHAMKGQGWNDFEITDYHEQALGKGSDTEAVAYIRITRDGRDYWGAGRHTDTIAASIHALLSAYNRVYTK
ncbi:2-isopropylmalate synthase [Spirochaeta thermophila DSM 6578]|uniref:2-isopropylmalate synthase n=1 Tax=Winmispira thermophila (strain ATCC 700085 / DSM 6578 / Z-1203) TaxID=869211 RepID=G0GF33_WINT7|nr:2-isopropylmalate synthase [Spirochaeta thermophila]AEJ62377.1 2-isopropylmalate synthase [Spirochaeta thermophila DSM 6578]